MELTAILITITAILACIGLGVSFWSMIDARRKAKEHLCSPNTWKMEE